MTKTKESESQAAPKPDEVICESLSIETCIDCGQNYKVLPSKFRWRCNACYARNKL